MMEEKLLHFSLGPVQDFVAQARKTRDFWAGSFILSYLSGKAILEILKNKGWLVMPQLEVQGDNPDDLLAALQRVEQGESITNGPAVPTLPNRFMAKVPAGFDPRLCVEAVEKSWKKIAGAVWQNYLSPVADYGRDTAQIWERQVNNFWEIAWAVGEDSALLDYVKTGEPSAPVEPGTVQLMGNLQEPGYPSKERGTDALLVSLGK